MVLIDLCSDVAVEIEAIQKVSGRRTSLLVHDNKTGESLRCPLFFETEVRDLSTSLKNGILHVAIKLNPLIRHTEVESSSSNERQRFPGTDAKLGSKRAFPIEEEEVLPPTPRLLLDAEAAGSEDSSGTVLPEQEVGKTELNPITQGGQKQKRKKKKKKKKKVSQENEIEENGKAEGDKKVDGGTMKGKRMDMQDGNKKDADNGPELGAGNADEQNVLNNEQEESSSSNKRKKKKNKNKKERENREPEQDESINMVDTGVEHNTGTLERDDGEKKTNSLQHTAGSERAVLCEESIHVTSSSSTVSNRPAGKFVIGEQVERRHGILSGFVFHEALAKEASRDKSKQPEDKWLLKPHCSWSLNADNSTENDGPMVNEVDENCRIEDERIGFGMWGVYDGHGGKQVATFASNQLHKYILEAVSESIDDAFTPISDEAKSNDLWNAVYDYQNSFTAADVPHVTGLSKEQHREWYIQREFLYRLPSALRFAFNKCNKEAWKRFRTGGTTATVAIAAGRNLVVANVGDSCAYLDTGSEVLAVASNHRLENSKCERERIEEAGGEVACSTINGKPAGPLRVWPGGLAMGRTIGDVDAGDLAIAEPDIKIIALPIQGCRLFIGSDGLWDAVHPKTAAHHCRELTSTEAAHKLLHLAIKKDKLKDDVTVVVVDFVPSDSVKIPPGLSLPSAETNGCHSATVWHISPRSSDPVPLVETDTITVSAILKESDHAHRLELLQEDFQNEPSAWESHNEEHTGATGGDVSTELLVDLTDVDVPVIEGSLYEELAGLKLNPDDLRRAMEAHTEAPCVGGSETSWHSVGVRSRDRKKNEANAAGGEKEEGGGKTADRRMKQRKHRDTRQFKKAPYRLKAEASLSDFHGSSNAMFQEDDGNRPTASVRKQHDGRGCEGKRWQHKKRPGEVRFPMGKASGTVSKDVHETGDEKRSGVESTNLRTRENDTAVANHSGNSNRPRRRTTKGKPMVSHTTG